MKHQHSCPKCGSKDIVSNVRPVDRGEANVEQTAQLVTYQQPKAFLFKGRQSTAMSAWVCADCGYVEFYADDPKALKIRNDQ